MTELAPVEEQEDDGFGGMKWECMCITLDDYQEYLETIRKSRNPDEKQLYKDIEADIIPELAKVAEAQARKEAKKMKELETLQKLATAKRSSRISAKMDKQKEIDEAEEAERKRREEIAMAKAEQAKQRKMEEVCSMTLLPPHWPRYFVRAKSGSIRGALQQKRRLTVL